MIPLVKDTIDKKDVDLLIKWLKTYPHMTKGELTLEYEKSWAEMLGVEYSVFVNSGSSAVLLMLYSLIESGVINVGDGVVVPSLSWSTDLAPVVQFGLKPILCDCNMQNLSIDLSHFEIIIKEEHPKVLLLVSVLGLVPEMNSVRSLCQKNGVILLEDTCESLGSSYDDMLLGSFGLMSCFSSYAGHHTSTLEGGMICTDNKKIYNILKALRSHGWDRDLDIDEVERLRKDNKVDSFNALYTFYYFGFNVRATDLQAFLGLNQLKKINLIVERRNKNYNLYNKLIINDYWKPQEKHFVSNFAYPIIHPKRDKVVKALTEQGVASRPLICGSIAEQPFWKKKYKEVYLPNASIVHKYGFYVPNNHQITSKEIKFICSIINNVIG